MSHTASPPHIKWLFTIPATKAWCLWHVAKWFFMCHAFVHSTPTSMQTAVFFKNPCVGVTVFGFLWGPGTTYVQCASMQVIACLLAMPRIYTHLTKRHLTKTACSVYISGFFHLTSSTISRIHLYTQQHHIVSRLQVGDHQGRNLQIPSIAACMLLKGHWRLMCPW